MRLRPSNDDSRLKINEIQREQVHKAHEKIDLSRMMRKLAQHIKNVSFLLSKEVLVILQGIIDEVLVLQLHVTRRS